MTTATAIYTADQLSAMSYAMVQTQAKNAGQKYSGIKKVVLIDALLKHYGLLLAESAPEPLEITAEVAIVTVASTEVEEVTTEIAAPVEITEVAESNNAPDFIVDYIYTTASADLHSALGVETMETLPIMNANGKQWYLASANCSYDALAARFCEKGQTFYTFAGFEAIKEYQLPYQEQARTASPVRMARAIATGLTPPHVEPRSNKKAWLDIAPGSEIKPIKPGSIMSVIVDLLTKGSTLEEFEAHGIGTGRNGKGHFAPYIRKQKGYGVRCIDDKYYLWTNDEAQSA